MGELTTKELLRKMEEYLVEIEELRPVSNLNDDILKELFKYSEEVQKRLKDGSELTKEERVILQNLFKRLVGIFY